MIEQKHLLKLRKFVNPGSRGLDLTKTLLCTVALGEKLSLSFYNNRKVGQAFSGLRRYKFIRHTKKEGGNPYSLTAKGEVRLKNILIIF